MKRTLFATLSCILLSILLLTACGKDTITEISPSATANHQVSSRSQSPHHETTFEDMAAFLNTVNADTFESGNFKDIIERVRTEGYIVQPYFDGKPAVLRNTDDDGDVLLCPRYDNVKFPPEFMYHLIDEEFWYRIEVMYIEEEFVSAAEENGYWGVRAAREATTIENLKEDSTISHHTLTIDGTERNVTVTNATNGQSYGDFVWDKYLIRVRGDLLTASNPHMNINLDILPHLSFEKMPLNSSTTTPPIDSVLPHSQTTICKHRRPQPPRKVRLFLLTYRKNKLLPPQSAAVFFTIDFLYRICYDTFVMKHSC